MGALEIPSGSREERERASISRTSIAASDRAPGDTSPDHRPTAMDLDSYPIAAATLSALPSAQGSSFCSKYSR